MGTHTRLSLLLLLITLLPLNAATYYVSPTGSGSNSGTTASPWDVNRANQVVSAGDTIILLDGNYPNNTSISPVNSGTAANPILFRAENKHGATFTSTSNSTPPISMDGKDYIIFDGLRIRDASRWFVIRYCTNITMTNCDMENKTNITQSYTIGRFYFCESVNINNCSFAGGSDLVTVNTGDNHLIENNFFGDAKHTSLILLGVQYSRVRGNTFYNRLWRSVEIETQREAPYRWSEYNVIENNDFQFSTNGVQYAGNKSIIRNNIFRQALNAFSFSQYQNGSVPEAWYNANNRFYNNVIAECGYNNIVQGIIANNASNGYTIEGTISTGATAFKFVTTSPTAPVGMNTPIFEDNIVLNNAFYRNGTIGTAGWENIALYVGWSTAPSQMQAHHNTFFSGSTGADVLRHDDGVPSAERTDTIALFESKYPNSFHNNNEGNPAFVDGPNGDFNLTSSSDCIDAGSFLSTTTSTGSGTSIPVVDAIYFSDGDNIVAGDLIRIGNDVRTVTNVNYNSNLLTVDASMSWTSGDGVALNYTGSAPDIGAYEYSASPINSAPIVNAGTDQNITLPTNSVSLNATVTDDGLPSNTLTFFWSVDSGPAAVSFADPSLEDTNATFTIAGSYVLRLTASDGALSTGDTIAITVNPPPQSRQITLVLPGTSFTASISPAGSYSNTTNTHYFTNLNINTNHTISIQDSTLLIIAPANN